MGGLSLKYEDKKIVGAILFLSVYAILVLAGNNETPKNIQLVEAQEMQVVSGNSLMPSWTALVSPQNALGAMIDEKEYLTMFLRETSDKYGVEYEYLYKTIMCESSFRTNVYGDNGLAYGIAQFHFPTFQRFCKGNYYNTEDQIVCMVQMFSKGLSFHWSCAR